MGELLWFRAISRNCRFFPVHLGQERLQSCPEFWHPKFSRPLVAVSPAPILGHQRKFLAHFYRAPVPMYRLGQGYTCSLTVLRASCRLSGPEGKFEISSLRGSFVRFFFAGLPFNFNSRSLEFCRFAYLGELSTHRMRQLHSSQSGQPGIAHCFRNQLEFQNSGVGPDR